jgi:phosphoribosylanthranilate isomerase
MAEVMGDGRAGAAGGVCEPAGAGAAPLLVKLCGMRTKADVAAVSAAAPDFAGFVVEVPGKRRSVTIERLRELTAELSPAVRAVGVFVNAPVKTVHRLLAGGAISAAQLHGDEDNAYIAELRQLLNSGRAMRVEDVLMGGGTQPEAASADASAGGLASTSGPYVAGRGDTMPNRPAAPASQADSASARIIQAFRVRSASDLARAAESAADLVLLDSGAGSGRPFDWQLLQGFPRPFLLAGGLGPDNIAQAAAAARAAAGKNFVGVDMSSGIETNGVKDPMKMNAAVAAAKGANR